MKLKICLLIGFLFVIKILSSQNFLELGTKWYYDLYPWGIGPQEIDYQTIEVISQDTIDERLMYKMQGKPGCYFVEEEYYFYYDSNRVYLYREFSDEYSLIYDFNKETDEGWETKVITPNYRDSFFVRVDSISQIEINGEEKKVQHISLIGYGGEENLFWEWDKQIIEDIGNIGFMFPQFGGCDPGLGSLRCKETIDEIYSFTDYECDAIIPITSTEEQSLEIKLYPTIIQDELFLSTKDLGGKEIQINIYEENGRQIKGLSKIGGSILTIDFSNERKGLKIIEIELLNRREVYRIIKM